VSDRQTKGRVVVIAVDGPAASGKGTISRKLAQAFGFAYLDTGALYRSVAVLALEVGVDPQDEARVAGLVANIAGREFAQEDLRSGETGRVASIVAAHPAVRAALLDYQRMFAEHPPSGRAGVVMDGRDIGTVVCPGADVKLFVTASVEERARRRHLELVAKGEAVTLEAVAADLRLRDARDAERSAAPLKQADDAVLLDTTELDIESAFRKAADIIMRQTGIGIQQTLSP